MSDSPIYERPAALLQQLIRFDTTNPPGNEAACVGYIDGLLRQAGIETTLLALDPNRPNLIARLPGRGEAPPLLLQGHVDVVTTAGQVWQQPPFAANLVDGYIWGRGAVDMKGGVAMMVSAFLRAAAENLDTAGDLILAIVSDEESGGIYGAKFLAQQHPEQFAGVQYAIGEFGGFTMYVGGQRFYPIMVTEKQICSLKATFHGPAGHGSRPLRGGAMAKLGHVLQQLDQHSLPPHLTPAARQTIEAIAAALPAPLNQFLAQLLQPAQIPATLNALGDQALFFVPMLHNTISPTIVRGGDKINVIPAEVTLEMDGRLLPGFAPDDIIGELRALVGDVADIEVTRYDPGPPPPNMGWYETLAGVLREADPAGVPIPLMLTGVTDARHFAQLGIQTYGFLPMNLPPEFNFAQTIHAADERIPAGVLAFGTHCIYTALQRM
ncbi:MAG: M20/M25/M40 family metallo-hydrolase [Ardenticatenaceae bacterium]|nr:M20/M25/M40 family metallo-hydrolase [Ardenticatenaceae bacterium]